MRSTSTPETVSHRNINNRVLPLILSGSKLVPIAEPRSCREVYIERRGYGLSLTNPLGSFELVPHATSGDSRSISSELPSAV